MKKELKETAGNHYLTSIEKEFKAIKRKADLAIDQLSIEELYWRPHEHTNSISTIMKHLSGNMHSRWTNFLHSDGEKRDRQRDLEFEEFVMTREEMLDYWEKGWSCLFSTISSLTEHDLLKEVTIRNEPHTVIQALLRQSTHYSSHVGQILSIGKQLKAEGWKNLSIPKGESESFNQKKMGESH
ncbi:DUF1572 family protein [Bacillus carboniphilus]|uniref:DUF1572 family protein n=2 Tax=Bacillus carboniphilus TaxID=86663 RepID=A0ABY9JY67_9BACI|nr:DUF1572 family protein [Bacillus carboniphilus]WLR44337.1 DUF1572 family protein [Bacillus carboniphilus]